MEVEDDKVTILSGLYKGKTIGSPFSLYIENKVWSDWDAEQRPVIRIPRPGHADLVGALKYGLKDIQGVIERASARETAIRTAIGAIAKAMLAEFEIEVIGHVVGIGRATSMANPSLRRLKLKVEKSSVFCADSKESEHMVREITKAKLKGETLGGVFEVVAARVPPGLGSYVQWDRRLDGKLARAVLSIPSVKAMEIGDGIASAGRLGSQVHDRIFATQGLVVRKTNRAGGIEGGVSNGELIRVRGFAKPIPTVGKPLDSVDLKSKQKAKAPAIRSDVCVVPAISVIGEAVVAWEIAECFVEKFGADTLAEMKRNYRTYRRSLAL